MFTYDGEMSSARCRGWWAPVIGWLGACVLVGSLWLPWYSAVDDGGPYIDDAWAAFDTLPVLLLALAAVGMLIGPVTVAAPNALRRLRAPGIAFGAVMAGVCTYRVLTPHRVTAASAEVGAFLATGACLVITGAWLAAGARSQKGSSLVLPDEPGADGV